MDKCHFEPEPEKMCNRRWAMKDSHDPNLYHETELSFLCKNIDNRFDQVLKMDPYDFYRKRVNIDIKTCEYQDLHNTTLTDWSCVYNKIFAP